MREEYNSVLSTPIEAETDISVKPKYRTIYRSISIYDQKKAQCEGGVDLFLWLV